MEMCTAQGHVVGMLDRDQRTAKMCTFDRRVVTEVIEYDSQDSQDQDVITRRNKTVSHRSVPGRTSPHSSCKTRKNGHFWKSLHRLKHALIVGTYLSLVTFPSILSAPTSIDLMSFRMNKDPKWLFRIDDGVTTRSTTPPNDTQLLKAIVNRAAYASSYAEKIKEDYINKVLKIDVQTLQNNDYEWLPVKELNLKLGENASQNHLESLELSETLVSVFTSLQKIAVGFEQIVCDEKKHDGLFRNEFERIYDDLCGILEEIFETLIEKNLQFENVGTEIMNDNLRNTNETNRTIRNWIIYRDYLIMLKYIDQVFRYFMTPSH